MKPMNNKGIMQQLGALGIGIVGLTITLVVGFLIVSGVQSNTAVTADGNATIAVNTLQASLKTIPGWVPLVVIAVIGALLLGLVGLFMGQKQ